MAPLSSRMTALGWVLQSAADAPGSWDVYGPAGFQTHFAQGQWSHTSEQLEQTLVDHERRIAQGKETPFLTSARLTTPETSPLVARLLEEHSLSKQSVLLLGGDRDLHTLSLLRNSDCFRVECYDPNLHPDETILKHKYHRILCIHLIDRLPPTDRAAAYTRVADCLRDDGLAWFSFYGPTSLPASPQRSYHEDGYSYAHGRNDVFFKAYSEMEARREILQHLGGTILQSFPLYEDHNLCWSPSS